MCDIVVSIDSMLKPEVMPPGWQIAPDKHVSSDQPIAGGKPTHRFRFVLAEHLDYFRIVGNPGVIAWF